MRLIILNSLAFVFLFGCTDAPLEVTPLMERLLKSKSADSYSLIAHAGGGLVIGDKSLSYSNSLEAIMASIEDGKKLIEVDLIITSDGVIVGAHHWSHFKKLSGYPGKLDNSALSLEQFKSAKIKQTFTPIDINDINDIFTKYPDLILVTDKIRDYKALTEQFDYPNRLIVECFKIDECFDARHYGIDNYAYNIDINNSEVVEILIEQATDSVKMLTFNAKLLTESPTAMQNAVRLIQAGFINLAYTANNKKFIDDNLGYSVSAFYTDYYQLSTQSCPTASCNVY